MKIIGRTKDGVLCEATDEELAHISGVAHVGNIDKTKLHRVGVTRYSDGWLELNIGVEIQVSPMWDWMTKARDTFKKITDTGKLLHGLADVLENAPPEALVEPDEAKTDG